MLISQNWLRQYLSEEIDTEKLTTLLTGCGLEVESVEPFESVKGGLRDLVVGEVLETVRHPNADRLTVTRVNLGNGKVSQIVCGAPNVSTGQKVIVAKPGTTIYPLEGEPFTIKSSKIRGEASEGMICAEDEIGLGKSHEGIIVLPAHAVPGTLVSELYNVEYDRVISIGLTPNRPDAASHIGVARDVAAVMNAGSSQNNFKVLWPSLSKFNGVSPASVKVNVEHEACIRYSGLQIDKVSVAPSPDWLQQRLLAVGLKPLNNIVDITNFVLMEYGQPLHAFDAATISGNEIIVKTLPANTLFRTLDNIDRKLNGNELMICDREKGLCIAGIFGGIHSGVKETTTSVFLESACFDPVWIRKASRVHGLKTDASFRFERGSDPEITIDALKRAALLIMEICPGATASLITDIYPRPVSHAKVSFSQERFTRLAGIAIPEREIKQILNNLDIKITAEDEQAWILEVPPYRVDVTREADVAEEILRIYGYDRIPVPQKMNASLPSSPKVKLEDIRREISAYLSSTGFHEIMSNSLTGEAVENSARILNPLSKELNVLRHEMLHPMLMAAGYNVNRKRPDLKLFEFGKTYIQTTLGYSESNRAAVLACGKRFSENWEKKTGDYNIYFFKSLVENIVSVSGVNSFKWTPASHAYFQFGLDLVHGKKIIASTGVVTREVSGKFDVPGDAWYATISLDLLEELVQQHSMKIEEPPRFPEVRRDLSMLLNKEVQYEALEEIAFATERKLLRKVNLFDIYQGDKIDSDKKSYALSFIMRDDEKTLTDKEIDKVMQRLMHNFEQKLGAEIRKG